MIEIELPNLGVYMQREEISRATDNPLTMSELLIIAAYKAGIKRGMLKAAEIAEEYEVYDRGDETAEAIRKAAGEEETP